MRVVEQRPESEKASDNIGVSRKMWIRLWNGESILGFMAVLIDVSLVQKKLLYTGKPVLQQFRCQRTSRSRTEISPNTNTWQKGHAHWYGKRSCIPFEALKDRRLDRWAIVLSCRTVRPAPFYPSSLHQSLAASFSWSPMFHKAPTARRRRGIEYLK